MIGNYICPGCNNLKIDCSAMGCVAANTKGKSDVISLCEDYS